MAFARASDRSLVPVDPELDAESSEESLLPQHAEERWLSRPRTTAVGLVMGALAACALVAVGVLPEGFAASAPSSAAPVTVRQLLEGPELADAVTDNFMNLGHGYLHPAQRSEMRDAVADNLANISGSIRTRLPADHAKLDLLELSQVQKESVLRLLRHYSDPRVLRLGSNIAQAVAETKAEAGSRDSLQRRLMARLQPHLRELRELVDDIVPGAGKDFQLDIHDFDDIVSAKQADKWNLKVEMTPPKAAHPGPVTGLLAARRLAPADTLSGTRQQASTVLHHLHGMLGESMPTAPARMLLFDKQKEYEQQTTGWERFETCVMDNMGALPDMFECLMKNCRHAMTWLMNKLHLGDVMEKMMSSQAS